jgi:hypothetical protein
MSPKGLCNADSRYWWKVAFVLNVHLQMLFECVLVGKISIAITAVELTDVDWAS